MTTRIETAQPSTWQFHGLGLPPIAARLRAVLRARLVDEITGEPIAGPMHLRAEPAGVIARASAGGIVGLVGRPARQFATLAVDSVPLALHIYVAGYLPITLRADLGPIAGFPDAFAPIDLGTVELHRRGTELFGRTCASGTPSAMPLPGASVRIDGYWPVMPPPNVLPATVMLPPQLLGVSPGFYAPRAAATTVRPRNLQPLPLQARALVAETSIGATRVRVARREALVIGAPLLIDRDDAGRAEIVAIDAIDTASSPDQPAWVTLAWPLKYAHPAHAVCVPMSMPAPGAALALARAAIVDDCCAFLAALPPWPATTLLEIDDGISPPEYQRAFPYETTSDGAGDFALPPLSRVAMVLLHATHAGMPTPLDVNFSPDYRRAQQAVLLTFA